jgi:hypothetical protein
MSKTKAPTRFRVTTGGADYLGVLGEKLSELAIMRVPELTALKPAAGEKPLPFDFVAITDEGVSFIVEVKTYSSFRLKIRPEVIAVLELEVEAARARAACDSPTPVVLFLFDGDRGHGRFLRLDTLPRPADDAATVVLSFPVENVITGDSIRALVEGIARERRLTATA